MKSRDLIETARSLTEVSPRRPSQANLRRAVSTAYYAMFHCLAGCAANLIIGRVRKPAWHQTYRALEHGKARNACEDRGALAAFPPEVRSFADMFAALQKARQQADYALDGRYDKLRVLAAIDMAEDTIVQFDRAGVQHRRAFVAHVLFKRRSWDDHDEECEMNEQRIREIAERAFKRQFPDVKLARVNVWPGVGFEDDSPVVDVHIIYDGKYEQLNADGLLDVLSEVVDKAYRQVEDDLGFPCTSFFAKSELGRRDLATV